MALGKAGLLCQHILSRPRGERAGSAPPSVPQARSEQARDAPFAVLGPASHSSGSLQQGERGQGAVARLGTSLRGGQGHISIPVWGSHRLASGARPRGWHWALWPCAVLLYSVPHLQALSQHMGMCSPEEVALLQLEEVFSATLARISNLVLQPLLTAGMSHSPGWRWGHRNCPAGRSFTWLGH